MCEPREKVIWEHSEKAAEVRDLGEKPNLPTPWLDFKLSELWENTFTFFFFFKKSSVWYFVMAALAHFVVVQ